jgi:hypothetical protein
MTEQAQYNSAKELGLGLLHWQSHVYRDVECFSEPFWFCYVIVIYFWKKVFCYNTFFICYVISDWNNVKIVIVFSIWNNV